MSDTPVKVVISVQGRFHAFNLAQQMHKHGALDRLLTTYPKFEVEKYGVPRDLLKCCPSQEILKRVWGKMPKGIRGRWNSQYFFSHAYDRFTARHLTEGPNIFVGWSGSSLLALRRAKSLGMTTIVERCSSHMLYQQQVLTEEYARSGLKFNETHPAIIEQELAEYDEADYLAIPSHFVRRSFLENGVAEEKLIQIPYGVDLSQFEPMPKQDSIFRIIQCGQVSLRKGAHYLLQAFTELNLPESELWFVGVVTDQIQPLLKQYPGANIFFLGHKPQAELKQYYRQCDVSCLMSVEEGLAYVQAQAMACGLPLICTTNTGGETLIRDGHEGFVIPIRDVEALKQKLLWCYQNRDACREMGNAAKQRIQQGFTWDDYGDRMLQEYRQVLSMSGGKQNLEVQFGV